MISKDIQNFWEDIQIDDISSIATKHKPVILVVSLG